MMKLSTKGRYGTRLMLDLALRYQQGPILLKDISSRQEVSEKYLWQLISLLKNAGLVISTRGAHGGYEIARAPKQITLKEIVLTLEGPLGLVECVGETTLCAHANLCTTREIWKEISEKILEILSSFTLADMVKKHEEKICSFDYQI
ncbi:Rrf2 family transcriptional regulator [bacterium]|nr:Rrf2 family transcriptional regulator [bacterium]